MGTARHHSQRSRPQHHTKKLSLHPAITIILPMKDTMANPIIVTNKKATMTKDGTTESHSSAYGDVLCWRFGRSAEVSLAMRNITHAGFRYCGIVVRRYKLMFLRFEWCRFESDRWYIKQRCSNIQRNCDGLFCQGDAIIISLVIPILVLPAELWQWK